MCLVPFSALIKALTNLAVRTGSLSQFSTTLAKHAAQFEDDNTYTLISRLRQNVIKTGIRRLSLSYSRISLRDICVKLHLDSEEDAEYIVGKAIRDGVIEGSIVHEKGWMECSTVKGGYGPEVSEMFGRRISFCLDLHNQSVKVQPLTYLCDVGLTFLRLCATPSMPIGKNLLQPRTRESAKRSLPRRSRKETWTTRTLEEISKASLSL